MASVGVLHRRDTKYNLVQSPPLIGEVVFAVDTEEYGAMDSGILKWKKFTDVVSSVNNKFGDVIITKDDINLGNVDNTSDLNKPISIAVQNALDNINVSNIPTLEELGLENVDNTHDIDKPISTDVQNALDQKLDLTDSAANALKLGNIPANEYALVSKTHTKAYLDDILSQKANLSNVYTQIVLDAILDDKANTSDVYTKSQSDNKFQDKSEKDQPNGYPSLDSTGKIPLSELPTSTTGKEIYSVNTSNDLPQPGENEVIYITLDDKSMHLWDSSTNTYDTINTALGETNTTAYRGDRGKIAYDHTSRTDNPHGVTASQINVYTKEEVDALIASIDISYIRTQETSDQIGEVPSGSTFNGTLKDALDKLFYNFALPVISNYDIRDDSGTPLESSIQYDQTIPAGSYTFTFDISNIGNVQANSGKIVYYNGTEQIIQDHLSFNSSNTIVLNLPELSSSSVRTDKIYIQALSTHNDVIIANRYINWIEPYVDPTIVNDDIITLDEDTPTEIYVLDNDTNADGISSTVQSITQPSHGTAVLESDNTTITYTPEANYNGTDSFTYTNNEGTTGTVNLTINPVHDDTVINDDSVTIMENTLIDIDVIANDTSVDGPGTVSDVQSITQPTHGTAVINSNGTIRYTPSQDYVGTDSFTYTNTEGNIGTVTVNVQSETTVIDDNITTDEDTPINFDAVSNDIDPDDKSPVQSITQPSHGSAVLESDGTITYTPSANYNGTDSFTYTNTENHTGTINLTINPVHDDTVINNDSVSTSENTSINIDVIANDTSVDGSIAPVQSITQPAHGSTTLESDGTVTYTPGTNYIGSDSFTYTNTENNTGTVTINVTEVQYPTTVNDDSATLDEDTSKNINVISNDTQVNGNISAVQSITQPSHGSAILESDGTVTYTPSANYNGTDSFTYTNTEGTTGTVNLTINPVTDITTVNNDNITLDEDTVTNINVISNDSNPDGTATASVQSITQPSHGSTILESDGTITYTPSANYNGTDSFTYTNTEGTTGTVNLTINPVHDDTVVNDDSISLNQDTSITYNVTANDTSVDGTVANISSITQPSHGTAVLESNNTSITYTPASGYYGSDSFTYTNTEGTVGNISVTVNQVQAEPSFYYGVLEIHSTLSETILKSDDFTAVPGADNGYGSYVFNAEKYDDESPNYGGTGGPGAYYTFAQPSTYPEIGTFHNDDNGFNENWDLTQPNVTVNGVDYRVYRLSTEQYAGDAHYTFSA